VHCLLLHVIPGHCHRAGKILSRERGRDMCAVTLKWTERLSWLQNSKRCHNVRETCLLTLFMPLPMAAPRCGAFTCRLRPATCRPAGADRYDPTQLWGRGSNHSSDLYLHDTISPRCLLCFNVAPYNTITEHPRIPWLHWTLMSLKVAVQAWEDGL
jgi:hypothetical protein